MSTDPLRQLQAEAAEGVTIALLLMVKDQEMSKQRMAIYNREIRIRERELGRMLDELEKE